MSAAESPPRRQKTCSLAEEREQAQVVERLGEELELVRIREDIDREIFQGPVGRKVLPKILRKPNLMQMSIAQLLDTAMEIYEDSLQNSDHAGTQEAVAAREVQE